MANLLKGLMFCLRSFSFYTIKNFFETNDLLDRFSRFFHHLVDICL